MIHAGLDVAGPPDVAKAGAAKADTARPVVEHDDMLVADDADLGRSRLKKAPNAFRTISEVADDLHIPQHVLRFWETKFPQVKPLKRGGGRRYYRPDDIALLRRISDLLYIQGYTIKGVQRLLREGGGKLSDDIPPAAPEEREDAVAEEAQATLELPIPGAAPPARAAAGDKSVSAQLDGEVERLRAVLAHTLRELESLRALLP
jgi:DNA-binding transcriptional MerR regulator